MNESIVIYIIITIVTTIHIRYFIILWFKVSYYKQKLKNANIDTSSVDNITLRDIYKL